MMKDSTILWQPGAHETTASWKYSYIIWEWVFWIGAAGIAAFGFYTVQGHLPDLTSDADKGAVAAEAFAIVNVARFAVPLRIGLALGTTPWVKENIVDKFSKDK